VRRSKQRLDKSIVVSEMPLASDRRRRAFFELFASTVLLFEHRKELLVVEPRLALSKWIAMS